MDAVALGAACFALGFAVCNLLWLLSREWFR